jgi:dienelactone hydrolase
VIRAGALLAALAVLAAPAQANDARAIRRALRSTPFFTEVFAPKRAAEGVVITLHKGSWSATGATAAASEHPDDRAWLRRRWLAVNSSYRPGAAGLSDIRLVYRRVWRAIRHRLPVCFAGASAGGNLALLAAETLPDLDCVVAEAAPTDLVHIASQPAWDGSSNGPGYIHDSAVQALGEPNLSAFSPLFAADRIHARVLLAEAEQDPLIPRQQLDDMCARLGSECAGVMRMAPGPLWFVHASVARTQLAAFRRAETRLAHGAARAFEARGQPNAR